MRRISLLALFSLALSSAFGASGPRVLVAAAASLAPLVPALTRAFEAEHPGGTLEFSLGASGGLCAQILHGAPFEVFMSADTRFPRLIVEAGEAGGPVEVYAYGRLILLSTKRLELSRGLAVLATPAVAFFAIGNPETAPYGRAALEALERLGLYDRVKSKMATAESAAQALQFTLTVADAGLVSGSSLASPEVAAYDREGLYWVAVDPSLYSPIAQGYVITKRGDANPAARSFADFLSSPGARAVFASFGYAAR